MKNDVKVYQFDMLFMHCNGVYLYAYTDNNIIAYRLEDNNTTNDRLFGFQKYVEDHITVDYFLNYIKSNKRGGINYEV